MNEFLRIVLPLYFLIYFGVTFVWRSYVVWRRTGVNPFLFRDSDSAYDYVGRMLKAVIALVVVTVGVFAASELASAYLVPIEYLQIAPLQGFGLGLLVFALLWTLVAQAHMGLSWRIGFDTQDKTELIQTGLFRISRNPIFFGMILSLAGLFCCLPSAFTLLSLILGTVLMQIQVRLEEEFLTRTHGEAYRGYCKAVPRWLKIPFVG